MFVVTGLNTKRRLHIGTVKSSVTFRKPGVERLGQPPTVQHSHRRPHPVKRSTSSSGQATPRVSELSMSRNYSDFDADSHSPIKVPLGRATPPRVRKFIPKPLILVERMKARQLLDSLSPVVTESCKSLTSPKTGITTPLSTHVTPAARRMLMRRTLSSDPHSSGSIFVRMSSRNGVVFGSGFGMVPRPVRPLSVDTLGDSSPSTDTFVADSPCRDKQASSKVPPLVTASGVADVHLEVTSHLEKQTVSHTGVPVLVESMTIDFVHRPLQSTDTFVPAVTSTPFASSLTHANDTPLPMAFVTSTVYPPRLRGRPHSLFDRSEIMSPTSRAVYPFNASKDAYIVNSGSAAPKSTLAFRRFSNRSASPSPTLVLDGVFALPRLSPSSSTSPRRTLNGFPRPRKASSRRPLSDISNAPAPASPSQPLTTPPMLSRGKPDPESPRSKLAHVLTAHTRPQTISRERKQAAVPPLVKGVSVSNDPRTQCEIEGLRVRRVVGFSRGGGGDLGGNGSGKGAIERMSLASVGMVARLRARWESGTAGHGCGSVDRCA